MKMSRSATFRYRGGQQIFASKPSRIWWDDREQCVRYSLFAITDFNQSRVTHDYSGSIEWEEVEEILSVVLEAAQKSDKLPGQLKKNGLTLLGLLGASLEAAT